MTFPPDSLIILEAEWRTPVGALVTPDGDCALVIRKPDDTLIVYRLSDDELDVLSIGIIEGRVDTTALGNTPGVWRYRWIATGTNIQAASFDLEFTLSEGLDPEA